MNEWQPMGSVPIDGTLIMLLFAREENGPDGHLPRERIPKWRTDWCDKRKKTTKEVWYIYYSPENPPIAWRPLTKEEIEAETSRLAALAADSLDGLSLRARMSLYSRKIYTRTALKDVYGKGSLRDIPNIGKKTEAEIVEWLNTPNDKLSGAAACK